MIPLAISNSLEGRCIVATSSIGQIVVLDDDMADRMIESMETANDRPFGQPTGLFKHGTEEDARRLMESWQQAASKK
jgi:hypothetical protein